MRLSARATQREGERLREAVRVLDRRVEGVLGVAEEARLRKAEEEERARVREAQDLRREFDAALQGMRMAEKDAEAARRALDAAREAEVVARAGELDAERRMGREGARAEIAVAKAEAAEQRARAAEKARDAMEDRVGDLHDALEEARSTARRAKEDVEAAHRQEGGMREEMLRLARGLERADVTRDELEKARLRVAALESELVVKSGQLEKAAEQLAEARRDLAAAEAVKTELAALLQRYEMSGGQLRSPRGILSGLGKIAEGLTPEEADDGNWREALDRRRAEADKPREGYADYDLRPPLPEAESKDLGDTGKYGGPPVTGVSQADKAAFDWPGNALTFTGGEQPTKARKLGIPEDGGYGVAPTEPPKESSGKSKGPAGAEAAEAKSVAPREPKPIAPPPSKPVASAEPKKGDASGSKAGVDTSAPPPADTLRKPRRGLFSFSRSSFDAKSDDKAELKSEKKQEKKPEKAPAKVPENKSEGIAHDKSKDVVSASPALDKPKKEAENKAPEKKNAVPVSSLLDKARKKAAEKIAGKKDAGKRPSAHGLSDDKKTALQADLKKDDKKDKKKDDMMDGKKNEVKGAKKEATIASTAQNAMKTPEVKPVQKANTVVESSTRSTTEKKIVEKAVDRQDVAVGPAAQGKTEKMEMKTETKTETKSETKTETKSETKTETKPETKADGKVGDKMDVKSASYASPAKLSKDSASDLATTESSKSASSAHSAKLSNESTSDVATTESSKSASSAPSAKLSKDSASDVATTESSKSTSSAPSAKHSKDSTSDNATDASSKKGGFVQGTYVNPTILAAVQGIREETDADSAIAQESKSVELGKEDESSTKQSKPRSSEGSAITSDSTVSASAKGSQLKHDDKEASPTESSKISGDTIPAPKSEAAAVAVKAVDAKPPSPTVSGIEIKTPSPTVESAEAETTSPTINGAEVGEVVTKVPETGKSDSSVSKEVTSKTSDASRTKPSMRADMDEASGDTPERLLAEAKDVVAAARRSPSDVEMCDALYANAAEKIRTALELSNGSRDALALYGATLLRWAKCDLNGDSARERLEEASRSLALALERSPEDEACLFNRGLCICLLAASHADGSGKELYKEACSVYDQLLIVNPSSRVGAFNCGLAYVSRARLTEGEEPTSLDVGDFYREAEARFRSALTIRPDDERAKAYLEECQVALKRLTDLS